MLTKIGDGPLRTYVAHLRNDLGYEDAVRMLREAEAVKP